MIFYNLPILLIHHLQHLVALEAILRDLTTTICEPLIKAASSMGFLELKTCQDTDDVVHSFFQFFSVPKT